MYNLLSYCGLTDARSMRAFEKDVPVHYHQIFKRLFKSKYGNMILLNSPAGISQSERGGILFSLICLIILHTSLSSSSSSSRFEPRVGGWCRRLYAAPTVAAAAVLTMATAAACAPLLVACTASSRKSQAVQHIV